MTFRFSGKNKRSEPNGGSDRLTRSLAATRSITPEAFSAPARDRILAAAMSHEAPERPFIPLFAPVGRLVAAGTLPLVLAGLLGLAWIEAPEPADRPFTVAAAKEGNRVVFTIANGGREHRVIKSDAADTFSHDGAIDVRGRFADRIDGDGPLVFYRIE